MGGMRRTTVTQSAEEISQPQQPPPPPSQPMADAPPEASPPPAQASPKPLAKRQPTAAPDEGSARSAFASQGNFDVAQRMAKALASSTLMPDAFRGNLPNCLIAMELASRTGASVLMVAQNLDIIHGRPSWRAQFLIATVNACGRFTPLRPRWQGTPGTDDWGCRAVASDAKTKEECIGPLITIALAKAEGWATRNGTKWKTMPELMLIYRAAAFWTRIYAPELALGIQTAEEVIDVVGVPVADAPAAIRSGNASALEAELLEGQS